MADTIIMPKLGFDMAEGTIVRWLKKEGEPVSKGDVIAEIETDKATVEVESSASGIIRRLVVDEGAVVPVGSPIAIVGTKDEVIVEASSTRGAEKTKKDVTPVTPENKNLTISTPVTIHSGRVAISPLARKIAQERNVDLTKIEGTGPGGRIVRQDVEKTLMGSNPLGETTQEKTININQPLIQETIPMTRLRQTIARRMTESKTSIPHFYVTYEYRAEKLLELREQFNSIKGENEKISVNDFIVKIIAMTLREFPNLNASLKDNSIIHHASINIGVAVALEGGLMTVVCRDADKKSLSQISSEMKQMVARVREGKVKPDDIEGSTISVSNLGMYAVENFAAIINPPEVAIIAVGAAREVPIVENGIIKPGWRLKATISVDHRASDGVEAARFMQAMEKFFDQPIRLFV
jgi:pyruvate dehydrogenase E2 component (dihydrolipoamide acetyltransferase)